MDCIPKTSFQSKDLGGINRSLCMSANGKQGMVGGWMDGG